MRKKSGNSTESKKSKSEKIEVIQKSSSSTKIQDSGSFKSKVKGWALPKPQAVSSWAGKLSRKSKIAMCSSLVAVAAITASLSMDWQSPASSSTAQVVEESGKKNPHAKAEEKALKHAKQPASATAAAKKEVAPAAEAKTSSSAAGKAAKVNKKGKQKIDAKTLANKGKTKKKAAAAKTSAKSKVQKKDRKSLAAKGLD